MSFLTGYFEAERYRAKLQAYDRKHPSAATQGKGECCRSALCCWRRPPALRPEDLTQLAGTFGLSEKKFFKKYCVVDTTNSYESETDGIWLMVLRREHQERFAGKYLPSDETFSFESPCVFLGKDKGGLHICKVHSSKPSVCAEFKCWEGQTGSLRDSYHWPTKALKELGWNGSTPND